ncbi:NADH-quinone oxidoreductase subunit J [Rhabdobacter roseus]|uniref:NADH-quinone oxidoreductase subunit J n=1 Tax=Rhabdobacter roseus TaxID=1655419 RepID=A0A840TEM9_9BACT|nr:NADH-quinone oxidoreductase subunit J [Rhabdobacter roseus]MBB5281954.1 NADH-quinone oxidoreductase subunit J [Rhabdobacter roseus]
MELVAFYGFSAMCIGSALFILLTRNLMYAAFALFVALLGVAALYVLAGADFLAVTQLMIYVGGILVLLIFGIMLTQTPERQEATASNRVEVLSGRRFWGFLASVAVFCLLLFTLLGSRFRLGGDTLTSRSTLRTLGVELMTSHLLPFEIAGVLLLVALIGAAYLALNRNPSA